MRLAFGSDPSGAASWRPVPCRPFLLHFYGDFITQKDPAHVAGWCEVFRVFHTVDHSCERVVRIPWLIEQNLVDPLFDRN